MNVTIDTSSPVPPYEQLRSQLYDLVVSGTLRPGTRLPPIRQLAGDLGLAVNTVGRAYKELEAAEVIETRGRHGTVVLEPPSRHWPDRRARLAEAARRYALEARRQGVGLDEAVAALRTAFPEAATAPQPAPRPDTAPRWSSGPTPPSPQGARR